MKRLIGATEFKTKCFKILDELEPEGIVISKRGRLVAKLTPLHAEDNAKLIGSMKRPSRRQRNHLLHG